MATPTLIWQQLHGWPQLRMTPVVTGEAEASYGGRTGIAVEVLMFARLAGVVLGMCGLARLLLADHLPSYRYLGATFLALYVVFVATAGRAYYLAGLYAPLAASGALGFQRRREAGGAPRRWLVYGYFPPPPVGSATSARTCTPSSSPARVCRGKPCGPD
jgi:hypothetical protein